MLVTGVVSVTVLMEMFSVGRRSVQMSGDSVTVQLSVSAVPSVRIVSTVTSSTRTDRVSPMCLILARSVPVVVVMWTVFSLRVQPQLAPIQSEASVVRSVGPTVCTTIS